MTHDLADITVREGQLLQPGDQGIPALFRINIEAGIQTWSQHKTTSQLFPEFRWKDHAPLGVYGMRIFIHKHILPPPPHLPTFYHNPPPCDNENFSNSSFSRLLPLYWFYRCFQHLLFEIKPLPAMISSVFRKTGKIKNPHSGDFPFLYGSSAEETKGFPTHHDLLCPQRKHTLSGWSAFFFPINEARSFSNNAIHPHTGRHRFSVLSVFTEVAVVRQTTDG